MQRYLVVRRAVGLPDPYYVIEMPLHYLILELAKLGTPLATALVGDFQSSGLGSRRDVDLPLHRDGEYSPELAAVQGGEYLSQDGVDLVALYCLRPAPECFTVLRYHDEETRILLRPGQALVFDNRAVLHGRSGPVAERLLLRIWIKLGRSSRRPAPDPEVVART